MAEPVKLRAYGWFVGGAGSVGAVTDQLIEAPGWPFNDETVFRRPW